MTSFYSRNVDEMYQKIVHAKIKFAPRLSEECRDLISRLLVRDPAGGLGSGVSGNVLFDADEIRAHPSFSSIDWDKLLRKEVPVSYVPVLSEEPADSSITSKMNDLIADTPIPETDINKRS